METLFKRSTTSVRHRFCAYIASHARGKGCRKAHTPNRSYIHSNGTYIAATSFGTLGRFVGKHLGNIKPCGFMTFALLCDYNAYAHELVSRELVFPQIALHLDCHDTYKNTTPMNNTNSCTYSKNAVVDKSTNNTGND
jgi:hypothetical protein